MNKKIALIGLALVGAGNSIHYVSKSAFLTKFFPGLVVTLVALTPVAMVVAVVGGFLVGFSLRGGVILGLIAAAVVYAVFWWVPA